MTIHAHIFAHLIDKGLPPQDADVVLARLHAKPMSSATLCESVEGCKVETLRALLFLADRYALERKACGGR